MDEDVPISVDYRIAEKAEKWSTTALGGRPWRVEIFSVFSAILQSERAGRKARILELGSGPGFLAKQVLDAVDVDYVALDFSAPMHVLARQHLGELATQVVFVERSLRDLDWHAGLGQFDYVITNQAVHELRHKRHASVLHAQVRALLRPSGAYLVSDHWLGEGGMSNAKMYMTAHEQREMLLLAGFGQVTQIAIKGDLVMHRASL
jgi:SAM-dependent methyltransferase